MNRMSDALTFAEGDVLRNYCDASVSSLVMNAEV